MQGLFSILGFKYIWKTETEGGLIDTEAQRLKAGSQFE